MVVRTTAWNSPNLGMSSHITVVYQFYYCYSCKRCVKLLNTDTDTDTDLYLSFSNKLECTHDIIWKAYGETKKLFSNSLASAKTCQVLPKCFNIENSILFCSSLLCYYSWG